MASLSDSFPSWINFLIFSISEVDKLCFCSETFCDRGLMLEIIEVITIIAVIENANFKNLSFISPAGITLQTFRITDIFDSMVAGNNFFIA